MVAPFSGLMLAIVARSGSVELAHAGSEILDELVHHLVAAQRLRDGEDDVGRGDAGPRLAGEPAADDLRNQHRHRLAERARAAFEAADAPAEDAEAVDHRRMAVHAEHRVRIRELRPSRVVVHTTRARYSRLIWWQMPLPGGTMRRLSKACAPQRRNA